MLKAKQIIDIKKLEEQGQLSFRQIGEVTGCSHQSVSRALKRLNKLEISHKEMVKLEPEKILALRYPNEGKRKKIRVMPNLEWVHQEMQKKGMTIQFVFQTWVAQSPLRSVKYSTFCRYYRTYKDELKVSMKLTHRAGECIQGDFAGRTLKVPFAVRPIQFFVGIHTHSQRFFILATLDQTTTSWIKGFEYVFIKSEGRPEIIVPDNPKAVVTKIHPQLEINPAFKAFADHYDVTVMPARPGHPQDKALVELAVKFFKQSIYPKLIKLVFRSLEDINDWLEVEVDNYNARQFHRRAVSREELFLKFDKPNLLDLLKKPFDPLEKISEINLQDSYWVTIDEHSYTVPFRFAHKKVQVQLHKGSVKVFYEHMLIAEHERSFEKGGQTKVESHLDPKHRAYEDYPKEHYQTWATETFKDGSVAELIGHFFDSKYSHSKRGNHRARKLQSLVANYESDDVVQACQYALSTGQTKNIQVFENILKSGVYRQSQRSEIPKIPGALLRGGEYYNQVGVER
ncbi:IS21 family transposase [Alteromonas lipotrueae]|uniref:IS21 family transposase n=1 Tax=Alteromonas lipotrueae TaxID=2803814 RepID=UPI001C45FEE3|nr:IS21 family transposase [Alteromonas lipotrueae]